MSKRKKTIGVMVQNPATWVRYKKGMCTGCRAGCCTMPVEATLSDLIRIGIVDPFEADDPLKQIAKRLKRARLIDHYNQKTEKFTLARYANDDCIYLDTVTRRCTIYETRPDVCRSHPQVGPRPGYCAHQLQE